MSETEDVVSRSSDLERTGSLLQLVRLVLFVLLDDLLLRLLVVDGVGTGWVRVSRDSIW